MQKIDELNIENRIEISRSEAENYEFIHESCVFSLLFFQPNICIFAKNQSATNRGVSFFSCLSVNGIGFVWEVKSTCQIEL